MWTRQSLRKMVTERLRDTRLILVSNREPYIHDRLADGTISVREPASGVVSALDPVMQAVGGTWIGHGSGSADRDTVDAASRVRVPPGRESYTLRRVWLTPEEEEGYYFGFANEALWPLCHVVHQRPSFREEDWAQYVAVNRRFADAVVEEAGSERVIVFIQDYHFALLPRLVKERLPSAIVAQFWHIPWPNPEAFRICPWQNPILEGLLGNDLLGFHIQYHCNNFLDTVDRAIEARTDREHFAVHSGGRATYVKPFPISVDFADLSEQASSGAVRGEIESLKKEYGLAGMRVGLGVDRMDYTKGLVERFLALDELFERYPEWKEKLVFIEIGVPTRGRIGSYQKHEREVLEAVEGVNRRHGTSSWKPVLFFREHWDRSELVSLYRMADFCAVTSLHDGMNLVAKEYVACRPDGDGVLVLSRFTGAAREFPTSLLVNPYARHELAEAMHQALAMPEPERRVRMEKMRAVVEEQNVFKWVAKLLQEAARIEA